MADTMIINGTACTVIYVDAGAAGGGDGLLPSTAFNTLPGVATIASNTVIMCRRSASVLTLSSGNFGAAVDKVYYLGAPKATDELFTAAPANIKTGGDVDWCGEVPDYAIIKVASNTDNHSFYKSNFGMSRIDFRLRSDQSGSGYVWLATSEQGVAITRSFFFTNMKIWVDGLDLSNVGYTTNYSYNVPGFINAYTGNYSDSTFVIKHVTMMLGGDIVPDPFFNLDYSTRSTIIKDVTIYYAGYSSTNSADTIFVMTAATTAGGCSERTRVEDVSMHFIAQNYATQSFPRLMQCIGNTMIVKNVSVTLDRYYNKGTVTSLQVCGGIVINHGATIQMENVTVDVTGPDGDGINAIVAGNYLLATNGSQSFYSANSSSSPESYIKNLTLKAADTSFTSGQAPNGGVLSMANPPAIKIDGITAWHYRTSVSYPVTINSNAYGGAVLTNFSVKGPLLLYGVTADIPGTWSCANVAAALLNVTNSTVYINTALLNAAWGSEAFVTVDAKSRVFVDNINVSAFYSLAQGGGQGWGLVACNNVQAITGNWQSSNGAYKGLAWNVHRVGGGQACIKLSKDTATSQSITAFPALIIGPEMLKSLEYTPVATGMHTATLHVAYKAPPTGPTDPDGYWKRFKVIVEVPDVEGTAMGRKEYVYSWIDGAWASDAGSTWVNDTGLTQKKIVIPFNAVRTDAPITVRVLFDWWDSLGNFVFYMDPIVEFAAL